MKALFLTVLMLALSLPAHAGEKETAFDRILRTGVIRCGYYVFPPVTYRDPKTNELSGFSVDMMNGIAKRAALKIEWTEEVTFGNWAPALQSGRFDVVCTPMWPDIPMARAVAFTDALFYGGLSPLVRADDPRFKDDDLSRLDKPDVTFVVQDGNAIDALTREAFPHARIKAISASTDGPTILQEIVTKKADAILLDRNGEVEYNKNNPVKLKLIDKKNPVKAQAFALVVGRDEAKLQDFLNNAIRSLNAEGNIDRSLKKWESEPDLFLRAAKPYEAQK